ncbi:hypothetical protein I6N90_21210 [Paenibacillus sp. GSMTC-2017]|uniref:hypothetical protein n=1 Tax=Paenibacillus sp. GSMTC-2017 TaxID=2794350 RepID=UPI0018D6C5B7|nr:hypothetical protein [Paenibacillus sp. GSMTC-2017]MBH5320314.1 hypothetical protein [Paenibacillus sp. GSMTC-2017]
MERLRGGLTLGEEWYFVSDKTTIHAKVIKETVERFLKRDLFLLNDVISTLFKKRGLLYGLFYIRFGQDE